MLGDVQLQDGPEHRRRRVLLRPPGLPLRDCSAGPGTVEDTDRRQESVQEHHQQQVRAVHRGDVNVLDNTMVVLSEYIQEYSSIGNYSVQFKGCCRLTSLVNNAGSYWQDKVMIQLATRLPNESPILARAMLVEAYAGQTMSFKIQSFQVPRCPSLPLPLPPPAPLLGSL
eukprot:746551-Hanusia_phi.AAC.3